MTEIIQPIPARIKNVAIGGHVAGTEDIIDDTLGKTQQTINQEVDNKIEALTSQDIEVVSALPAVGDADPKKIYRVTGTTSYTDYMLNPAGSAFSQLATFSFPGIDEVPTAGSNNLVKSGGTLVFFNSKVFTSSGAANRVIRHLFIDTSGYTGEYSLEGLKIRSIVNASTTCGFALDNANNQVIFALWYSGSTNVTIQEGTSNGVYAYAEFNWDNLPSGSDRIQNVSLTDEPFKDYNDPRTIANAIKSLQNNGYLYVGRAMPTTNPGTPSSKVFYIAVTGGTYTNFGGLEVSQGLNILKYNGSAWSLDTYFSIDNEPTVTSLNLVRSTGMFKTFNTNVFSINAQANQVIRHLFIDTSGYTGEYSLTGIRLKNIFNNGENQCGFIISNSNGDTLAYHWYTDTDRTIHEWTENGIYAYAEFNWDNLPEGTTGITSITLTTEPFKAYNDPRIRREEIINSDFVFGAAGDSITASSNWPLEEGDIYTPLSGLATKSWAYFIAKHYEMPWHNYGISGTTLGDVVVANTDRNGFSKENGRYTQMADDLTHITIWFGWNDDFYGPRMRKQMWVQETYSNNHWYPPRTDSEYIGRDGYVTQEEYDAVNAVTGTVGGIQYDNSEEYWNAVYVGTKDDTTNKTYWGAFNIVLPYLINKYPYAKILVISPYNTSELMRQATRDAAFKYGLQCYDFGKDQNQMFAYGWQDESEQGKIGNITVERFRTNSLLYDGTHPNLEGNKYLYPSIGAKLMGL